MRTRSVLILVAGLTALLLAACADDSVDEPSPPSEPPAETVLPPRSPPASLPAPPVDPPQPPPTGEVTVSGVLVEGVEPSCILLETEDGQLFLLFGDPVADLRAEASATIRGEAQPNMASTCQQGTPFEVHEIID